MAPEVFISYARLSSAGPASALKAELGEAAFLDSDAIEAGDTFPPELFKALLGSRVVVVFVGAQYFQRWYCLREIELALQPFRRAPNEAARRNALDHVVVVLPPDARPVDIDHLPPALRQGNWPSANDVQQQAQVVRAKLAGRSPTLAERIGDGHEKVLRELLDRTAKPAPFNLASSTLPLYPVSFPDSLHDEFVGRSNELALIHHVLSTSRGTVASAALTGAIEGFGGMGKTRLALEYVHRYGPRHFPGGIFWVEADQPEAALKGSFHGILLAIQRKQRGLVAETLGRPVPDAPEEYVEQKRDARQELALVLQALADREPILYVVDNVPEPASDEDEPRRLDAWCPARGKVALLVTSRQNLSAQGGIQGLPIEELPAEEALQLLTGHVRSTGRLGREEWLEIAEWVGRHPMALDLLNQVLRHDPSFDPKELLQTSPTFKLDERLQSLKTAKVALPELLNTKRDGIRRAFSISYEKLSEPSKEAARLLARLAPTTIPSAIIQELGPGFSAAVVTELFDRHFVMQAQVGTFGSMHRLMADYLRGCSPEPGPEAEKVAHGVTSALREAHTKRDWRLVELCVPHARELRRAGAHLRPETLALLALTFSNGVGLLGGREEALQAAEEAVSLYRKLAETEPATLSPNLAGALNNLSGLLGGFGKQEEALRAAEESTALFLSLVQADSKESVPGLAISLVNLSTRLGAVGDREGALQAIQDAVQVFRSMRQANPDAFEEDLARALNNLAICLGELGRREEALAAIQEAVELFRPLARARPEPFEPDLAVALLTLSKWLGELGRHDEALSAIQEAAPIHERLAKERPAVFQRLYAGSLNVLSAKLSTMGRREEALEASSKAVEIQSRLSMTEPATVEPELATSLNNLSVQLGQLGRRAEALKAIEKAVQIRRRLAKVRPAVFEPVLAMSLDNLATRLSEEGRDEEALEKIEEAMKIRERLAKERPEAFEPDLAHSLTNHSIYLSKAGRKEDALRASQRSVELSGRLAKLRPKALEPLLATALNNHSNRLMELGRSEEALEAIQEAVRIRKQLAALMPGTFEPYLASSLYNMALCLETAGKQEAAVEAMQEAVEIRRRLAAARPEVFTPDLARSLHHLAHQLLSLGRSEEAAKASAESLRLEGKADIPS